MLKEHLPRVIYHQVYWYTKIINFPIVYTIMIFPVVYTNIMFPNVYIIR